jgi:hypothetical protein
VERVYCLLPTLHDIGATPNGQRLTVYAQRGRPRLPLVKALTLPSAQPVFAPWPKYGVASLAWALRWLPLAARQLLVQAAAGQSADEALITADRLLECVIAPPHTHRVVAGW